MGDRADYYREQELYDDAWTFPDEREYTRDSIWITREGQRIPIRDLEDSHLLNIIRCFRGMSPHGTTVAPRDPSLRRSLVNVLANEAYARGLSLAPSVEGEPTHE